MKGTVLAVETGPALRRAALLKDGRLEALEIDRLDETRPLPGAIYRCRVTGLIAGLGAATADLGGGETGFFPDANGLSPGQSLLAEVRREAEEGKAARLSPTIDLHGEYLVLTPSRPGINPSRKIADPDERARLRAAVEAVAGAEDGFVIRTHAKGASAAALTEEAATLTARYAALCADPTPGLRQPPPDAAARVLAIEGTVETMLADEASRPLLPAARLDPAPFETLDIDAMIDALRGPCHDLAEGWLSIDPTPALVAVDVNTGSASHGKAALRVNLDAAAALPRLLALRKIGGVLCIDFAGAPRGEDRKRIAAVFERAARSCLKGLTLHGWGPAGLLEATCRRPGRSLAQLLSGEPR